MTAQSTPAPKDKPERQQKPTPDSLKPTGDKPDIGPGAGEPSPLDVSTGVNTGGIQPGRTQDATSQ